jgi:hypothetical protein
MKVAPLVVVCLALAHPGHAADARARSLVLDPLKLAFAGYLGGNTDDQAFSVAVDAGGNLWLAGSTESANFPIVNALQPKSGGATDAFVAEIAANGTTIKYATYLGGSGLDVATGIALDASGNIYVTGFTNSGDFPVTKGVLQTHLRGALFDAFVAKISPSGALVYSTYLGGHYVDAANAIAVDTGGDAYVTGYTCSYDFPTKNAFQPFLDGGPPGCFSGQDAFVAKLGNDATTLVYSTFFGGSDKDEAKSIALDAQGRAAIVGYTMSSDLPTAGFALTGYSGGRDAFVARIGSGGALEYASYFGGTGDETAMGVGIGSSGDLYVAGYSTSSDLPTSNAFQPQLAGPEDGFAMRIAITATNADLVYATFFGGGDADRLHAIAVDPLGNAYAAGYTESLDFPMFAPFQAMFGGGTRDAVVARFNPNGMPTFSTYLGGTDDDIGWSLAIAKGPAIFVAGETLSTDLGTAGAFEPNAQGASDGFAARIAPSPGSDAREPR